MIKAETRPGKPRKIENYPCIGISTDGLMVLFHSDHCGTTLNIDPRGLYPVGHYLEDWDMSLFYPVDGEVILRNID